MADTLVTWTALPHGEGPDGIRLSVYAALRLGYPDGPEGGTLADYGVMADWPAVIAGLSFRLVTDSGAVLEPDQMRPDPRTPATPDSGSWARALPRDLPSDAIRLHRPLRPGPAYLTGARERRLCPAALRRRPGGLGRRSAAAGHRTDADSRDRPRLGPPPRSRPIRPPRRRRGTGPQAEPSAGAAAPARLADVGSGHS